MPNWGDHDDAGLRDEEALRSYERPHADPPPPEDGIPPYVEPKNPRPRSETLAERENRERAAEWRRQDAEEADRG